MLECYTVILTKDPVDIDIDTGERIVIVGPIN